MSLSKFLLCDSFASFASLRETAFFHAKTQSSLRKNTTVGDMALIIQSDFFTDETEMKSTIPGFSWDEFLERGKDKHLMGEEVLRRYYPKARAQIHQATLAGNVEQGQERIVWDERCNLSPERDRNLFSGL